MLMAVTENGKTELKNVDLVEEYFMAIHKAYTDAAYKELQKSKTKNKEK